MSKVRLAVSALALSATAFVSLLVREDYRGEAYYATPHEKAAGISTIGFGATEGVKPSDKTTVVAALQRARIDATKYEGAVKRCVKVDLHQYEYDAYSLLAYNIGEGAFCSSTLVRKLNAGDYAGACAEISRWDKQGGKTLRGLTVARAKERAMCEGKE